MLRVSGVVALLLSCVLAVVLFTRVQTLRLTGTARHYGESPLRVRLDLGPGSVYLRSGSTPLSLPASTGSNDATRVVELFFDDPYEAIHGITENAGVIVIHRGVEVRRWLWAFGSTEIESEGRTFVVERSRAAFFGTLGLVAAAPVLLWALAALLCLIPRRRPEAGHA